MMSQADCGGADLIASIVQGTELIDVHSDILNLKQTTQNAPGRLAEPGPDVPAGNHEQREVTVGGLTIGGPLQSFMGQCCHRGSPSATWQV